MARYASARLQDIPRPQNLPESEEGAVWKPVRHHFGVQAFGVNAWTARSSGDEVIEDHDETGNAPGHEELYFVSSGHATFTVDGDQVDAPAGTFVYLPTPGVRRKAIAKEPGTTVLAVGGWPDRRFEVSAWERRWTG
jgi:glyoxylate utilization-related uncharacterized protein